MSGMMQNKRAKQINHGIGVSGLGLPKESYNPSRDNATQVARKGATDALKVPSLDFAGNRREYWANEKEPE